MLTQILANASLFEFLLQVDGDIANTAKSKGCAHCNGPLDAAPFPRKPRGGPPELKEDVLLRFSLLLSRRWLSASVSSPRRSSRRP